MVRVFFSIKDSMVPDALFVLGCDMPLLVSLH
jgi:hypothetical protein